MFPLATKGPPGLRTYTSRNPSLYNNILYLGKWIPEFMGPMIPRGAVRSAMERTGAVGICPLGEEITFPSARLFQASVILFQKSLKWKAVSPKVQVAWDMGETGETKKTLHHSNRRPERINKGGKRAFSFF